MVAAVVGDVLPNKFLGLDDLIIKKIGGFLQNPLTMIPGMIVAIFTLCTSLAQTYLNWPVNRFAA